MEHISGITKNTLQKLAIKSNSCGYELYLDDVLMRDVIGFKVITEDMSMILELTMRVSPGKLGGNGEIDNLDGSVL